MTALEFVSLSLTSDDKWRVKQAVDVNYMAASTSKLWGLHLKTEQEQAVRNLYVGKDVLAVLPTGFGKSRIYQAFSLQKSCENTGATLIIIAPLTSIIEDQLADLRSRGFRAAVLSSLNPVELEECSLEIILYSAEGAITKEFTSLSSCRVYFHYVQQEDDFGVMRVSKPRKTSDQATKGMREDRIKEPKEKYCTRRK